MERGMSVSELARRTGLSRATIIDIENNRSDPRVQTVKRICSVLKEKPNIFF
jgi:DNA-binding XRE family transcriptional regulator